MHTQQDEKISISHLVLLSPNKKILRIPTLSIKSQ